jgi:hypothetical protein
MSNTGSDKQTAAPSIKALLSAISAEIGDNPELIKQAFDDANALQRQQQRTHYDARRVWSVGRPSPSNKRGVS